MGSSPDNGLGRDHKCCLCLLLRKGSLEAIELLECRSRVGSFLCTKAPLEANGAGDGSGIALEPLLRRFSTPNGVPPNSSASCRSQVIRLAQLHLKKRSGSGCTSGFHGLNAFHRSLAQKASSCSNAQWAQGRLLSLRLPLGT